MKGLVAYIERAGERASEQAWQAALALVVAAAEDAREARHGRWRSRPRGELRRLRRDLAEALELARLAVELAEECERQHAELELELREAAAAAARARRRAQTLPAEQARLAKAAARKSASNFASGRGDG